jgi:hypothetical protein
MKEIDIYDKIKSRISSKLTNIIILVPTRCTFEDRFELAKPILLNNSVSSVTSVAEK